jgi:inosose dehydratase
MEILTTLSRRSLLLAAPLSLLAAKPNVIRVGCQTDAWPVDPKNFESLVATLAAIKQLGFDGFETSFVNVRSQFERPNPAYDRIRKTGLRFLGIDVSLKTYDPQTAIPSFTLLQQIADGGKALEAERIIVSGDSTVHPLALRAKADALTKIAKHCKGVGIACAYRNRDVEFRDGGAQIEGLLRQTDSGVHFVLDAADAIAAGANVAEFFAKSSKRIDGIHLRSAQAGQAEYDYAPLAKEILAASWRGWLVADEPAEETVLPSREAIRRVFGA